ncbi:hypothetical protein [Taklimakanibacter deserti]|uniref:hypothetical protein n=1 Tax=Taklimakanibacter deserti TaxID=2267839 RepID=UPI000E655264
MTRLETEEENWKLHHPRSTEKRLAWRRYVKDGKAVVEGFRFGSPQDAQEAIRLGKGEWSFNPPEKGETQI